MKASCADVRLLLISFVTMLMGVPARLYNGHLEELSPKVYCHQGPTIVPRRPAGRTEM